jgi:hypothetical protein
MRLLRAPADRQGHVPTELKGVGRPAGVNGEVWDETMATGAIVAGRGTFEPAGGWGGDHHDGVPGFMLTRHDPADLRQWPLVTYVNDVTSAICARTEHLHPGRLGVATDDTQERRRRPRGRSLSTRSGHAGHEPSRHSFGQKAVARANQSHRPELGGHSGAIQSDYRSSKGKYPGFPSRRSRVRDPSSAFMGWTRRHPQRPAGRPRELRGAPPPPGAPPMRAPTSPAASATVGYSPLVDMDDRRRNRSTGTA